MGVRENVFQQRAKDEMSFTKLLTAISVILVQALMITFVQNASAFDPTADRTTQIQQIHDKYDSQFVDLNARLASDQKKSAGESAIVAPLRTLNSSAADLSSFYSSHLSDPNSDLSAVVDYLDEEFQEATSTLYQIESMITSLKIVKCQKGKVVKKITALAPTCPKGYKKVK
jgi:hypothetical protein